MKQPLSQSRITQASRIEGYNAIEYCIRIMMSHESDATGESKTVLEFDQDYSRIEDCSRIERRHVRFGSSS